MPAPGPPPRSWRTAPAVRLRQGLAPLCPTRHPCPGRRWERSLTATQEPNILRTEVILVEKAKELTLEEVLKDLNPSEREQALLMYQERGETPQEIKEFFDSL